LSYSPAISSTSLTVEQWLFVSRTNLHKGNQPAVPICQTSLIVVESAKNPATPAIDPAPDSPLTCRGLREFF